MAFWNFREELSQADRIRRSYYELLRDELDQFLLQYALIASYNKFASRQAPFPFVEKRELKPRARIPDQEYESQNAFLLLFVEDVVTSEHKKYIRFFDVSDGIRHCAASECCSQTGYGGRMSEPGAMIDVIGL